MDPLTQFKNATILALLIALGLGCFGLSLQALAVEPPAYRSYPNQNSAENEDALYRNTTGSDGALASWIWRSAGRLSAERYAHTATLLQNGMVLVAGGFDRHGGAVASAEVYDPASKTWTATGSLNTARAYHTATLLQDGMVLVAGGSDS